MRPHERIYLALDVASQTEAKALVAHFSPDEVGGFKVGGELFLSAGPAICEPITARGHRLFVDLKLHDIPRTVEASAKSLASLGASLLTVHASGGPEMLQAAVQGASINPKTRVLGVTVLTSHTQQTLSSVGVFEPLAEHVMRLAHIAIDAGLSGLVCSAHEVRALRAHFGEKLVLVCPGIRPQGARSQDQKRIATPKEAMDAGATYLVVGRPVLQADDRKQALVQIVSELS